MSSSVERLAAALGGLAGAPVELERPSDSAHGDYATNVALRLAPARKTAPRALAQDLADRATEWPDVERAEVAGPGFLNLFLARVWFGEALAEILERGADFGGGSAQKPEKIQVELVSANPTGPMTVGAARNGAYGDSVARLLEFAGHTVEREYYWNDAGKQMDRFRASVDAVRRGEAPPEDGYHGDYIAELATVDDDPVPAMLEQILATLERFRVHFTSNIREIELVPEIPEAIALLDTYEADGTVWARTSEHGDDKDRPLLRSADGSHLYFAADAAYLKHKLDRFDRAIYVLGSDHHGYVARLKAVASMMGFEPDRIEVLLYQLVNVVEGGVAQRMAKRRGNVVLLEELMDLIGVDATRWYLVARGHDQTIELDVDVAQQHSKDNTVYYVQYAHARIAGILRNAEGAAVSPEPPADLAQEEKDLVKRLADFPAVVAEATERRAPHALPTYLVRVADDFHRFYHHHKVLGSDAEAFRLALCKATQTVIARGLDLVGVEAPERM